MAETKIGGDLKHSLASDISLAKECFIDWSSIGKRRSDKPPLKRYFNKVMDE